MQKFVIYSHPRSGSNYLCEALNLSEDIICHGELFNPDEVVYAAKSKCARKELEEREVNELQFLNDVYQTREARAVGFKHFVSYSKEVSNYVLRNKEIKKLILQRKNLLRSFVSLEIAFQTNVWFELKNSPEKQTEEVKIELDVRKFIRSAKSISNSFDTAIRSLEEQGQDYLLLQYEKMVSSKKEDICKKALSFISKEIKPPVLKENSVKQNKGSLEDCLVNYDQVCRELKGTKYEWMLAES